MPPYYTPYLFAILWLIVGAFIVVMALLFLEKNRFQKSLSILEAAKEEAKKILEEASADSQNLKQEAEKKAENIVSEAKKESSEMISKAEKTEARLLDREEKLENKFDEFTKKQEEILQKEEDLKNRINSIEDKEKELENKLGEMAKLSEEEAKNLLMSKMEQFYEKDALTVLEKHRKSIEDKKVEIARDIIIKSIQQYASDVTNEVTTTVIELESDEIKGKLIGKEGRNITCFEKETGVSLIIDDSPNTVFISAFDLFRRYVAKKSLERLIEDGRIQPARIEEVVEKTKGEAELLLRDLGNATITELNILSMPDEIIPIIGKLRFRTSYGQNILKHSKEVAIIAEQMAKDLGVDSEIVKIGGLLHDIGKALDSDIEGTHPEIGGKLARKNNMDERIVDMIENHHGNPGIISIYAAIVQMADAVSSVRPGARREAIEQYMKRVQDLEALVQKFPGVSKAYAVSAGREIRVFVNSETVSDIEAHSKAKEIANKIQEELSYPGEVKVNLIRESRVIEYAK